MSSNSFLKGFLLCIMERKAFLKKSIWLLLFFLTLLKCDCKLISDVGFCLCLFDWSASSFFIGQLMGFVTFMIPLTRKHSKERKCSLQEYVTGRAQKMKNQIYIYTYVYIYIYMYVHTYIPCAYKLLYVLLHVLYIYYSIYPFYRFYLSRELQCFSSKLTSESLPW